MTLPRTTWARLLAILACAVLTSRLCAQTFSPFGVDAYTLHLWHLNETATPAADAVTGSNNLPMEALIGVAAFTGSTSLSGTAGLTGTNGELAGSLYCNTGTYNSGFLLAASALGSGVSDDVPFSFADPSSGAFTYEAIIKFDPGFNPLNSGPGVTARTMQIISDDGNNSESRVFQFRFNQGSGPSNSYTAPTLQLLDLGGLTGTVQTVSAAVPYSGSNAVDTVHWFHVAVTYNGNADTANNVSLYWTELLGSSTTANLIGTGELTSDLPATPAVFVIGGRGRDVGTPDGFAGAIDDVRISNIVRSSTASGLVSPMMVGNIDSANDGVPDWWELYYFGRTGVSGTSDLNGSGYTVAQDYAMGYSPTSTGPVITSSLSATGTEGEAFSYQEAATNNPTSFGASGLPSWLTASSTSGALSGTPTSAGTFTVELTASNASGSGSAALVITIDPPAPVISGTLDEVVLTGSAFSYQIEASNTPTSYTAFGLPAGLSINSSTGVISGTPTSLGLSTITISAVNASGTTYATLTLNQVVNDNPNLPPPGPEADVAPVTDGSDIASSGYAYGGSSGINTSCFICSGIQTLGNQQFMTFYGQHQTNPSYAYNGTLWVARRTIGAATWQIFRTTFTPNDITDGHDVVSFGIDGNGYMHMSWGMHNASGTDFHYTKSLTPVTGTNNISFAADSHNMTGNEVEVTYPQFLTMPNGDLLYLYRDGGAGGGSGNGNTFWDHYSLTSGTWTNVNLNGTTPVPMINGEAYSYNGYPNMPCLNPFTGELLMTWTWRYTPDYLTNENMGYAQSSNYGSTWQRSNGSTYDLGLAEEYVSGITTDTNTIAQNVLLISQTSSLINQAGMCLDQNGNPVIATWWAPGAYSTNTGSTGSGNNERQYMIAFPTTTATTSFWAVRQVSNRTVDSPSFIDTSNDYVRDLGRPVALTDQQGRVLVVYRDDNGPNCLKVAYSETAANDPNRETWNTINLAADNLGGMESVVDLQRWQRDNTLELIYQAGAYTTLTGTTYSPPANTASAIGVFEWNEQAYFAPPTLSVSLGAQDATLSWNSILGYSYQLWTSTDLVNWTQLGTFTGADRTNISYVHTGGATGKQHFWKLVIAEGAF